MKTILFLLFTTILTTSGCSLLKTEKQVPEVKVITQEVPVDIYQPPLPQSIRLEDVKWFVVTEKNLEGKLDEIRRYQGGELVVFSMTPQAYENMSYNLQEIRRYIRQQKEIILYYRRVTQNEKDLNDDGIVDITDWELQSEQAQTEVMESAD